MSSGWALWRLEVEMCSLPCVLFCLFAWFCCCLFCLFCCLVGFRVFSWQTFLYSASCVEVELEISPEDFVMMTWYIFAANSTHGILRAFYSVRRGRPSQRSNSKLKEKWTKERNKWRAAIKNQTNSVCCSQQVAHWCTSDLIRRLCPSTPAGQLRGCETGAIHPLTSKAASSLAVALACPRVGCTAWLHSPGSCEVWLL